VTTTLQKFKPNDPQEQKFIDCILPSLDLLGVQLDSFFDGANECFLLGDILFVLNRSPLADIITQDIFRESFTAIHEYFTRPGTFEFYLEIFRKIWGNAVEVEFIIPAPGKLQININALSIESANFLARRIVSNHYLYDEVMDHDGNNLCFQVTKGIKTQQETDALITELYPQGIWVQTTLTIT
jgi:hypothetical protein